MKTILYATDRTEQAAGALRYAHDLSIKLGADLIVFYVHQMPPIRVPVTRLPDQIELQVIEEQEDILWAYCIKHLGDEKDTKKIRYEVVCNDSVLNAIIERSNDLSPDLVMIGRKNKHTDRGLFAGDIGQSLVKRLSCPVLIMPNDLNCLPIQNILYATDFEEADFAAIKNLVPMVEAVNGKIYVVHIGTENQHAVKETMEWFKEMLKQQVDDKNLEFKLLFAANIEKKLNVYSQLLQADILALMHREEKGFFQNLFNKSLIQKMEKHVAIPLIIFNKPAVPVE